MSGKKALELGLEVIGKIKGYADAAHVIPDPFISCSNYFLSAAEASVSISLIFKAPCTNNMGN